MNQTLANGFRLLEWMAREWRPHSVREAAGALGLPASHIHRLLQTLVELGYVRKTEKRKYYLTFKLFEPVAELAASHPLRVGGAPLLRQLSERWGGSAHLIVPETRGPLVILSDHAGGQRKVGDPELGKVLAADSASGRLFAAWFDDATLSAAARRRILKDGHASRAATDPRLTLSLAVPVVTHTGELVAALGQATTLSDAWKSDTAAKILGDLKTTSTRLTASLVKFSTDIAPPGDLTT